MRAVSLPIALHCVEGSTAQAGRRRSLWEAGEDGKEGEYRGPSGRGQGAFLKSGPLKLYSAGPGEQRFVTRGAHHGRPQVQVRLSGFAHHKAEQRQVALGREPGEEGRTHPEILIVAGAAMDPERHAGAENTDIHDRKNLNHISLLHGFSLVPGQFYRDFHFMLRTPRQVGFADAP